MRIALVSDVVYPYVKGGAERRFYEIGQRLGKEHDVHLFCMKYWQGPDVIKQDRITLHGVCKAKSLYTKDRRSISEALHFGWRLYRPLRKERFDVIDCSSFPFFSLFACRLAKRDARFIATWHEVWGKDYWLRYLGVRGYIGATIEWLASRMPQEIVSVSSLTKRKLKTMLHVRMHIDIIANGIDYENLSSIGRRKKRCDVLYAGRLIPDKGVNMLLGVMTRLKDKTLVVIGEGIEKERLIALAKKLGIDKRVTFLPFQHSPNEVYKRMAESRVVALPSRREGFGIIVIEANACGTPVVTIRHADNAAADLVQNGSNGVVCEPNERSLAEAIKKLLKHPINPDKCRQAAKNYDWNLITDTTLKNYYHSKA